MTVFLFSFSLAATGFAEENGTSVSKERLTPEELNYLVNGVGNTQEESEDLPVQVSRRLIEEEAKVIDSGSEFMVIYDSEVTKPGQISTFCINCCNNFKNGGNCI
ncbi:hypothetical protein SOP93_19690 [Peribacillus frigoritolerans]|uniref:hypothetical protein n=1 Tax=Peribacillus frigoritolerans TaxID=450367 RepID=UPI002B248630|nr:hypothetical protein [Peribacillus frigoritolerans]MEB2493372.1 hypothetical protein [Peribacillus frigoritolerans]